MNSEQSAELDALSAQFTDRDYDELESRLQLKAAALNWTGDPMQQPAEIVLAAARGVLADRNAAPDKSMKEIEMTDCLGDLTAEQIDHLAKGLELAHGLTLQPAGGGRVWLAHVEGGALLVMPNRTVKQIWRAAEIISQTEAEYEAGAAVRSLQQD